MWRMSEFLNTEDHDVFLKSRISSIKLQFGYAKIPQKEGSFQYDQKMWQMARLIRHTCGEREKTVGHRCSRPS